jgi:hypothetical protein
VLLDGEPDDNDIELAARLTARFSQGRDAERVTVEVTGKDGASRALAVKPYPAGQVPADWYI